MNGLYYQRGIKLKHVVEKGAQYFTKERINMALTNIHNFVKRERNKEIRPIYSAAKLSTLSIIQKPSSYIWYTWNHNRKKYHVKNMQSYQPTVEDSFQKPSNAGRKSGSHAS